MAGFTTEDAVRLKFQLMDPALVASELIEQGIDDAHTEVLTRLAPAYVTEDPEAGLVLGETLLAGAHVLRSLAGKEAFDQKRVSIGGQRIEEGTRFASLLEAASLAEEQAWSGLAPFLAEYPGHGIAAVTDTIDVIGEE